MSEPGIDALRRAKELIGTESAVAELVGVTQPHVNHVLNKGKKVPAEWCIPLETATNGKVTRHELRPDLYPQDQESAA